MKHTQKTIILIIAVILVVSATLFVYEQKRSNSEKTVQATVTQILSQKYSIPQEKLLVSVTSESNQFAKGTVNFEAQGGGVWFAANTERGWELAYDGNGIIPCDVADRYSFPVVFVPQCINTGNSNELIQRIDSGAEQRIQFSSDGTLTRNNPGQKPGAWYLIYEKPGAPALSVELDLNSLAEPYIDLVQGERVNIEGELQGNIVIVRAINKI